VLANVLDADAVEGEYEETLEADADDEDNLK